MSGDLPKKRIIGYADQISVAPGEVIEFKVSCEDIDRYEADIVRLRSGDLHPKGRGLIETAVQSSVTGSYPGRIQPINAGSYGRVSCRRQWSGANGCSVQCWIWPTTPGSGDQVLMGDWVVIEQTGFALMLDDTGAAAFRIGDRQVSTGVSLPAREWAFVGASYDRRDGTLRVWQSMRPPYPASNRFAEASQRVAAVTLAPGELLIAAARFDAGTERIETTRHFNGKIEAPRVFDRPLDVAEAFALQPDPHADASLIAAWDFSCDICGTQMRDVSGSAHHGELINLPARAMTGHSWTGEVHDWKQAPAQYGAVHFHDDDIYDCNWQTDFSLRVPAELASGVYAARVRAGDDEERIPFVVRPGAKAKRAGALVLLPTASYLAYANEHCGCTGGGHIQVSMNHVTALSAHDLLLDQRPELGYSMYDTHSDGSGVCYSSRLRPVLNFRPCVTNSWVGAAGTIPWQFNADLALLDWLEHEQIEFDVATDEDLHEHGASLLAHYRTVLTPSHPEYYSTAMHDAVGAYLRNGGRLMYLGGNGFYWRVAYHATLPGVMELRRAEDGIRDWVAAPGEYYMSFTGEYGGLWQRNGRPIQALVGIGMAGQGFDDCGYYRRTPASSDSRVAFMFADIDDELIGDFGTVGGGAAGIEVDRFALELGSPRHALVVATSEGLNDTYFPGPEDINGADPAINAVHNPDVRADMTFFETPRGGGVFSVGSIAYIGSLSWNDFDNNVAKLTGNVLRRFLDPQPFEMPT